MYHFHTVPTHPSRNYCIYFLLKPVISLRGVGTEMEQPCTMTNPTGVVYTFKIGPFMVIKTEL